MSRKIALALIILTLVVVFMFDSTMLILQSGRLEKIINSIQKFDSFYSANLRMHRQLTMYYSKLKLNMISKKKLETELNEIIGSPLKVKGNVLTFKGKAMIDAKALFNLLANYTNVSVRQINVISLIPVKYTGFSYNLFKEKVVLENLSVEVYGG